MNFTYFSSATNDCVLVADPRYLCSGDVFMCSRCTCDEVKYVLQWCETTSPWMYFYDDVMEGYVLWIVLGLSLLTNCFLLATLMQPAFAGSNTFVYLRIISVVGLLLLIVQVARKIVRYFPYYNIWHVEAIGFLYAFTYVSDSTKLLISTFSTFLSLERFLSIVTPIFHSKINKRKFIWLQLFFSAGVGCVTLIYSGDVYIIPKTATTPFIIIPSSIFPNSPEYNLDRGVLIIRLLEACLMIGFSITTVGQLRVRNRRLKSMLVGGSALKEERRSLNLCRFQIIETAVAVAEMLLLCLNEIVRSTPLYQIGLRPRTFKEYLAYSSLALLLNVTFVIEIVSFQLSQLSLFTLYLIFSPTFRSEFLKLFCRERKRRTAVFRVKSNEKCQLAIIS